MRGSRGLPEYTTRKFLGLLAISVIVSLATVFFMPPAITHLFPSTTVYYQISTGGFGGSQGEPFPTPWARLNHTFIAVGSRVDSYLEVLAVMEPDPSPSNVTIRILFEPYDFDPDYNNLVPTVIGGSLEWSGEMHLGDTVTVHTALEFPSDGRYFVGGSALSSSPWAIMGGGATGYYVWVQWGQIVKIEGSSFNRTESRCIAHC